jgi:hypothetical protein
MRAAFGVWLELLLSRSSIAGCSVLVLNLGQGSRWLSFSVRGASVPWFFKGVCGGVFGGDFLALCIVLSSLNELACSSPAFFEKRRFCLTFAQFLYYYTIYSFGGGFLYLGLILVLMFYLQA